ncbi:MAG: hypothetical protein HC852_17930 [Acaryochloridaceae cyanobacterium RU_4_10]|nr:hypothetical protein [Acaryochloridaceae cyanobacterium RU_4_10]
MTFKTQIDAIARVSGTVDSQSHIECSGSQHQGFGGFYVGDCFSPLAVNLKTKAEKLCNLNLEKTRNGLNKKLENAGGV